MKVTIEFSMDSDSFYLEPQGETIRVLERAGDIILQTPMGSAGFKRTLLDTNGNSIGSVTVVE